MGRNRTTTRTEENPTVTDIDEQIETAISENPDPAIAATAKRTRKPLDVGQVAIREFVREDVGSRPSRISQDPVYKAVEAAEFEKQVHLSVSPENVDAVNKRLRSAADPKHLNVGMNIIPGNPVDPEDDTKVIVTFIKRAERQTRKPKAEATTE